MLGFITLLVFNMSYTFKCHKVKLITDTKDLYYWDNKRGKEEVKKGRKERRREKWIAVSTEMYHGKNNKNLIKKEKKYFSPIDVFSSRTLKHTMA